MAETILALAYSTTGNPQEIFSVVDGTKTQLSQHGKRIADKKVGRAHLLEYTHEDGTPIDGLYNIPTSLQDTFDNKTHPMPTIVIVHGGPYARISDSFDIFWHWTTYFMSLGYLILLPNYRGGRGHGNTYASAVHYDASQSYQDVLWLVKKGVADGHIDPERVAMTGWSQGGYMSYWAAVHDSDFHFTCIIPGAGVTDWTTMGLTSDLSYIEGQFSGPRPWDTTDITDLTARKCSPLFFTQNVKSPILILHGEQDPRTPPEQALAFFRALKKQNKDVTMVTYPRESHCVPVPWEKKHWLDMMRRMERFLAKHLLGEDIK